MTDIRWDSLTPMLPSKRREPFDSPDWIFELKWGGVRALAFVEDGRVTLLGQNRRDLTPAYPELQGIAAQVGGKRAVLDGEIVGLGPKGRPELELLLPRLHGLLSEPAPRPPFEILRSAQNDREGAQNDREGAQGDRGKLNTSSDRLGGSSAGAGDKPPRYERITASQHDWGGRRAAFSYEVTDLLMFEGEVLLGRPLWQRKNLLHGSFTPTSQAQVSGFIETEGVAFFDAVSDLGLEGMVAKERYSPYVPGRRTRHWLEVPALSTGNYVVGGYTFGGGRKKAPFESLLLGAYRGAELVFVGRATASLSNPEGWRTVALLEALHSSECPFVAPPRVNRLSFWCRPDVVCQVRAGERGPTGELRFALFVCLRPDLAPLECVWEGAEEPRPRLGPR